MEDLGKKIVFFRKEILKWYELNGRDFPWRNKSTSNYQIIISEVLLQRTKAETIAKFYRSFINKYPSWKKLGGASELEIQNALKPIGLYKQRGSRLYKLTQEMVNLKGRLPSSREEVEKIPLMGQYLTNAWELLIHNRPAPLLDVNMARVLERFFGPRKLADIRYDKYLQNLAYKIINVPESRIVNWAILDFAALICKARNSKCQKCPILKKCLYVHKN